MVCCGGVNCIWALVVLLVHLHRSAETLLDHIPDVVSLEEGEKFMYSYPCEEGVVEWLCYYVKGAVQPLIFSDVASLPPFLQEGTTSAIQECPGFSTYNITFMVTTSMSGLLMFYANGSGCNTTHSVGPRPFLFNITTAACVQPRPTICTTSSTPSQSNDTVYTLPYHIPEVVSLKEGKHFTYSYPCEEGVVDWLCYYIDGMVQPAIFDVANLPPFLQDGTSSANQECPGFSTYNITFTVTTSMSGLFMFYAKGSGCDFTNGVGPRPFLFNITTACGLTCEQAGTPETTNCSMCFCPAGYTETRCEEDVNECLDDPCENGATCNNTVGGYLCICATGYTGFTCDQDIDECTNAMPCMNGATCNNIAGSYGCICDTGYTGFNCSDDVDECNELMPCKNGATCNNTAGSYTCICNTGYTGFNCSTCNETCESGMTCEVMEGMAMCVTVNPQSESNGNHISDGAIAGIVIGCFVVIFMFILPALIIWVKVKMCAEGAIATDTQDPLDLKMCAEGATATETPLALVSSTDQNTTGAGRLPTKMAWS